MGLFSVAESVVANIDGDNFTAASGDTKKPSVWLGLFG